MSNRPIKFRVWDKKRKNFLHNLEQFWDLIIADGSLSFLGGNRLDDDFSVQQFTGLLDKNGKEIYEGDLVNFYTPGHPHGPEREDYEKREVWYCPDSAAFLFDKYYYDGWHGYPAWDIKGLEVVGNIFESLEITKRVGEAALSEAKQ